MLTKVTRLEKLGGFRLRFSFTHGSEGVHDFSETVQESDLMMEPLRDEGYFNRLFSNSEHRPEPTASTSHPNGEMELRGRPAYFLLRRVKTRIQRLLCGNSDG